MATINSTTDCCRNRDRQENASSCSDLQSIEYESNRDFDNAALKIQRSFRSHIFRTRAKMLTHEEQNVLDDELFSMHFEVALERYPAQPLISNLLSSANIETYLATVSEYAQGSMARIIQYIKRVSFKKFKNALRNSFLTFMLSISSLPEEQRDYVIVADEVGKSTNWVASVASESMALLPPKNFVSRSTLTFYLKEHPGISNILFIDDATYSGEQISTYLTEAEVKNALSCKRKLNLHFVIPYMTSSAKTNIRQAITEEQNLAINFAAHQQMISIADLPKFFAKDSISSLSLKRDIQVYSELRFHGSRDMLNRRTLTYFDHKIADYTSTDEDLLKALVTCKLSAPYKTSYNYIFNQLEVELFVVPEVKALELDQSYRFVRSEKDVFIMSRNPKIAVDLWKKGEKITLCGMQMLPLQQYDIIEVNFKQKGIKLTFDGEKLFLS